MNEVATQDGAPFARMMAAGSGMNVGSIAIEQERAIAEAQGKMTLAKRFPRSMVQAHADFMEACKSPEFAATAFYSVPNRGSGPSIRFMEEAARCYGNFDYGHRELSRSEGKSEVEVYAWDMEKNNFSRRQITVLHVRDTSNGPKKLNDQNDIDGRVANVASKQMRGRIAALMPKAMVAAGIAACKLTIAGGNDKPISARVADMTQAFTKYGVTVKHLTEYLGHTLDNVTLDELVDLIGVFNAIKEGAKPSDYFSLDGADKPDHVGLAVNALVAGTPAAQGSQAAEATKPRATRTTMVKAAAAPEPAQAPPPAAEPAPEPAPAPAKAAAVKAPAPAPAAPEPEHDGDDGPPPDEPMF